MRTLYDLLGARPDDDAERLRTLFRGAAKANHPDLHPGDPYAAMRFSEIAQAYDILRDPQQRATYDRLLEFERKQFRSSKPVASFLTRNIVAVAAGIAMVLGGGYGYISKILVDAARVEVAGRGPARIAGAQPAARTGTVAQDKLRDRPERALVPEVPIVSTAAASAAHDGGDPEVLTGRTIPSSTRLNTEVAKRSDAFGDVIRQADAKTAADRAEKDHGMEPLEQNRARPVEVRFSPAQRNDGVAKSSTSDFAIADVKHDKIRDGHEMNGRDVKTSDVRMPGTKTPARPRALAKRQTTSRATFEQAALETKNTPACEGSCSEHAPAFFGVGF